MKFLSKKSSKAVSMHLLRRFAAWMNLSILDLCLMVMGNMTMAFAIINIHIPSQITEGGVLGGIVLLNKIFGIDPSILSVILDFSLYGLGILLLERGFLKKAVFSTLAYATSLKCFAWIGPVLPSLIDAPYIAAIVGGLLLGAGCGLVVTRGGAAGGDDCLALILKKKTPLSLSNAYFFSDGVVLFLSFLVYLPAENLIWSFLTTLISSYVVGQFELRLPKPLPMGKARQVADRLAHGNEATQAGA